MIAGACGGCDASTGGTIEPIVKSLKPGYAARQRPSVSAAGPRGKPVLVSAGPVPARGPRPLWQSRPTDDGEVIFVVVATLTVPFAVHRSTGRGPRCDRNTRRAPRASAAFPLLSASDGPALEPSCGVRSSRWSEARPGEPRRPLEVTEDRQGERPFTRGEAAAPALLA